MANPRNISLGPGGSRDSSQTKALSEKPIIYIGKVIKIDEKNASNRLKVYVEKFDKMEKDRKARGLSKGLPWATPFLPLHLNIVPKVGEYVKILLHDAGNGEVRREYIGPIVSQKGEYLIKSSDYDYQKGMEGSQMDFDKSITKMPKAKKGLYPTEDEIAIQGRENTDIIFKPSEILIRAHKYLTGKPYEKNEKNPAYINIKTLGGTEDELTKSQIKASSGANKIERAKNNLSQTRTDINLVSNKIYLIGRDTNSSIVKPYFSDKKAEKLEEVLHPIVYGDILKQFIQKLYNWAKAHQHPYANLPQNSEMTCFKELENWMRKELPKLNSKNIFAGGDTLPIKEDSLEKLAKEGKLPSSSSSSIVPGGETRVNGWINRVDDDTSQPQFKVESRKVSDDNGNSLVEIDIVNPIDGSLIETILGEGPNETLAYASAVTSFMSTLKDKDVKMEDIFKLIPQLQDIITN